MPARKSASHELAQKKLWKQEYKALEASLSKVNKDFDAEQKQRVAAVAKAERSLATEQRKYTRFIARREKVLPKSLKDITTRMAVLRGRIEA